MSFLSSIGVVINASPRTEQFNREYLVATIISHFKNCEKKEHNKREEKWILSRGAMM
jgi:hypothetical protein